ncbi:urate hydroxylase PuuD [Reyranella sp.]|uniref:urate hydroxylase PuuD n=1 Tax=Reyranella sp. TaxID=1929291 RepID=UPI003D107A97
MDAAFLADWLNLLLRWAHMIVGIAWIGASFYFIWLDNHLHPPLDPADAARGISGEVWAVHGGGFYTAKKFKVAPEKLPPELHWFMWEAYTTLITGFLLLCLVYYHGAEVALIDPRVMALDKWEAIGISLVFLIAGWLFYDWLCRSAFGEDEAILGGLVALYCGVAAWALCHIFSGRGAYLHFGAMLGVIMVLNVYFVIIPGQKELVKAKQEGRVPDSKYGLMGRQRSVHNTYFTLPVLFTMISNHYAGLYGHEWNWVLLLMISVAGALIRIWFVQRHKGNQNPLVLASGLVMLVLTAILSLPRPTVDIGPAASFAEVQPIFQARCQPCHATKPTQEGFSAPPKGVILETQAELRARAAMIKQQVWDSAVMPPGNLTNITDDERRLIARWIKGGAQ